MGSNSPLLPYADEKASSTPISPAAKDDGAFDETSIALRVGNATRFGAVRDRVKGLSKGKKIIIGAGLTWLALGAAHKAAKGCRSHRFGRHGHGGHGSWDAEWPEWNDEVSLSPSPSPTRIR
jgi:hypothetical protein